jgi:predicted ester cyclase
MEDLLADNDLKAVVRRLYDAFNGGEQHALDALIADAFVEHEETPGFPPDKAGLKQFVAMVHKAFPDVVFKVADIASEADKVWARVVVTGTQRGEYFGIQPTGRTIHIEVFDVCRIVGSQIAEHWGLSDQMGLMRQLGVLPSPATSA